MIRKMESDLEYWSNRCYEQIKHFLQVLYLFLNKHKIQKNTLSNCSINKTQCHFFSHVLIIELT